MVAAYLPLDYPKLRHIAAQGPLCPCATNALINVGQCRRFAHSALKPCGLLEQRRDLATCPSFIPLNAELAACRTSRQRERDYPHHAGRNSDHCQRCLALSWPLVLMARRRSLCQVDPLSNRTSHVQFRGIADRIGRLLRNAHSGQF